MAKDVAVCFFGPQSHDASTSSQSLAKSKPSQSKNIEAGRQDTTHNHNNNKRARARSSSVFLRPTITIQSIN